ncbi:hypothetical protein PHYPSEUDO_003828 [Phytophthora pseudosyringae]|uniref:Uncharacterized protein n=1 Tax=Phytophthora pseudosyringae TaxID=221518 RepID=A0A8T1WIG7_9STRA|nr:hypothetical protein PHYPSEUDO_003828 [Phytophthora pseudosyringae]
MAAAFGSNPYVIVEKYPNGQSCLASGLTKITTYLADGKCHMTASASYRATRKADGSSGVTTYTDTSCAVGGATLLDATTSQVTDSTCIPGATNGDDDRKVYGGGATPLYLQSIVNYDTMTGGCKSPVVPTQLVTTVVLVDACAPTTVCAGTVDPFTSTACSSTLTYKTDVAAAFVSSPYLIVESYTSGQSCDATQLSGITTYLADGKCHKTATASYRATRKADGSSAIKTYTGTSCAAGEATLLAATAAQVTGNSCTAGTTGIVDMKVYGGGGVTADVYSSTINYDTATGSCVAPAVPTEVVTTVESTSTCVATSVCAGVGDPYTSTSCTSALTYKSEMAAVFGSNPYVIVEKYTTTKGCSASQQIGTTVFLADAKCHKIDASGSYAATISSDGVSTVKMYTDATCGSTATTLAVSAAQATSKTCVAGIVDTLVYAGGATPWMWSAVTVFDDKTCAKAVQSTVTRDFSCTVGACVAAGDRSFSNACPEKYLDFAKLAFKSDPYVVAEVYQDSACATLQGVMVYSADTKCHVTMDGAASFTATLDTNGAGVIVAYDDNKCTDSTPITTSLTSAQLSSHSCVSKSKFYAFNVPAATSPPSTPTTAAPETPAPTTTTQTPTTPANAGSGNGAGSLYSSFAALATGFTLFGWMAVFLL